MTKFNLNYKKALELQDTLSDGRDVRPLFNGITVKIEKDGLMSIYATSGKILGRWTAKLEDDKQKEIEFFNETLTFTVNLKPLKKIKTVIDDKTNVKCVYEDGFLRIILDEDDQELVLKTYECHIIDKMDKLLDKNDYTKDFSGEIEIDTKALSKIAFNGVTTLTRAIEDKSRFMVRTLDKHFSGVIAGKLKLFEEEKEND